MNWQSFYVEASTDDQKVTLNCVDCYWAWQTEPMEAVGLGDLHELVNAHVATCDRERASQ